MYISGIPRDPESQGPIATIESRFSLQILAVAVPSDLYIHCIYIYIYICTCLCTGKALRDVLKQLNQDVIVVDVGAPEGAQLNHDLSVRVRHLGKSLPDVLEQLNQDLIVLGVGHCQGAGTGQLIQEKLSFDSWVNCLSCWQEGWLVHVSMAH